MGRMPLSLKGQIRSMKSMPRSGVIMVVRKSEIPSFMSGAEISVKVMNRIQFARHISCYFTVFICISSDSNKSSPFSCNSV